MVADFRSTGAINSGTTNFSGLSAPAGVLAGDILLSLIETDGATTLDPPGVWQNVPNTPITTTNGSASRLHLWWRRAASDGDSTPPNIGTVAGLNHFLHRCISIKECPLTSDPIDVVATQIDTTIDTTTRLPGITTTDDNCLIVHAMAMGSAQTANNTTRYTSLTAPSGITAHAKRIDNGRIDGNDGCIGMWTGRRLTSGAMVSTTGVCADSDSKLGVTIAFKTAPVEELPIDLLQQGSSSVDGTSFVSNGSMYGGAESEVWAGLALTGTAVAAPTLSGLGRTWSLEEEIAIGTTVRLCVFKGVSATPTGGTVTITSTSGTLTGCNWAFMRRRGGDGVVVQKPKLTQSNIITLTLTWAAAADSINKQLLFFIVSAQATGNTVVPDTNWTEDVENVRGSPGLKLGVWKNLSGTFDTSTAITDDGTTYDFAAIGLELNYEESGAEPQSQEIVHLTASASQRTIVRTAGVVSRVAPKLTATGITRTIARTTAVVKALPRLVSIGVVQTIARTSAAIKTLPRITGTYANRTIARSSSVTRIVPKQNAAGSLRLFGRTTAVSKGIPRQTGAGTVRALDSDTAVVRALARLAGNGALRGLATVPGVVGRPIPRQTGLGAIRAFGVETSGSSSRGIPRLIADLESRDFVITPGGVVRAFSRGVITIEGRNFSSGISGQTRELPKLLFSGAVRSLVRSPGVATRVVTRGILLTDSPGLARQAGLVTRILPRLLWPGVVRAFVHGEIEEEPFEAEILGPTFLIDVMDTDDPKWIVIGPYGTIALIQVLGPEGDIDVES